MQQGTDTTPLNFLDKDLGDDGLEYKNCGSQKQEGKGKSRNRGRLDKKENIRKISFIDFELVIQCSTFFSYIQK